eukprot:g63772.t1
MGKNRRTLQPGDLCPVEPCQGKLELQTTSRKAGSFEIFTHKLLCAMCGHDVPRGTLANEDVVPDYFQGQTPT